MKMMAIRRKKKQTPLIKRPSGSSNLICKGRLYLRSHIPLKELLSAL
jgi:hypothetical protein